MKPQLTDLIATWKIEARSRALWAKEARSASQASYHQGAAFGVIACIADLEQLIREPYANNQPKH